MAESAQIDPGDGSHTDLYPSELQALKAEVRKSSDDLVLERLVRALPALALVFAGSAASDLVVGHELGRHLAASGSVMAVISFWMYRSIGAKRMSPVKAHRTLAAAAAMAVANSMAHLYFAASPREIVVLLGVFGLLSYTALSLRWLLAIEGVAIAAWISVAWNSNLFWPWLPLTGVLAAGAALSVVIVRRRATRLRAGCRKRVIEERLEMQARTERHRKQLRETLAVAGAGDGHWYWDLKTEKTYFSDQWAALLGFEPGELSDNPDEWLKRIHHFYLADVKQALSKHLYGKTERFQIEYRIQHRDGTYLWVLSRGVAARDDDGNPIAIAGSLTDISQLMEIEKRILDDAFHDKLTGLPNRQAFMARLERAVQRSKDFPDSIFAVVFLDLDRFKIINDSLGHLVGDQLLAAAAARLRGCQRRGDIVARFGGDEFVMLMEDLEGAEDAVHVGNRIRDVLAESFKIGEHDIATGASIGIAFNTTGVTCAEDLVRNADTAMYHAKTQGRGNLQLFNAEMHAKALRVCQLQNDLGQALDRQELQLRYQPIVSARTGRIVSAEALLRWQPPGSDLIGPAEFIPLAEEMGLIGPFGEWVLRQACLQNAAWRRSGLPPLTVAVNLSARQLQREQFPQDLRRILSETKLDPRLLQLELTESALMDGLGMAPRTLGKLEAMGIRISIDDFGTGYSSLSYLTQYKFDCLKIDRSFVSGVTTNPKAAAVAKGIIALAHNLNLEVTAEGVESEEQLAFLLAERCDKIQGYLASRPIRASELEHLLRSGARLLDPFTQQGQMEDLLTSTGAGLTLPS